MCQEALSVSPVILRIWKLRDLSFQPFTFILLRKLFVPVDTVRKCKWQDALFVLLPTSASSPRVALSKSFCLPLFPSVLSTVHRLQGLRVEATAEWVSIQHLCS